MKKEEREDENLEKVLGAAKLNQAFFFKYSWSHTYAGFLYVLLRFCIAWYLLILSINIWFTSYDLLTHDLFTISHFEDKELEEGLHAKLNSAQLRRKARGECLEQITIW